MNARLKTVIALNPDFEDALNRNEKWAVQHRDMILGLDGEASRQHPERTPDENGKPRNWCESCPHVEGCVMCDLDENPTFLKEYHMVTNRNM